MSNINQIRIDTATAVSLITNMEHPVAEWSNLTSRASDLLDDAVSKNNLAITRLTAVYNGLLQLQTQLNDPDVTLAAVGTATAALLAQFQ